MSKISLSVGMEFENQEFADLVFCGGDLTQRVFENCIFKKCNLSGVDFSKSRFFSCRFIGCDLSNGILKNARLRDIEFQESKGIGLQWIHLDDITIVIFGESNLRYSNFSGLQLKRALFTKCDLQEADFTQSDLSDAKICDSNLLKARFNGTNLTKADLRGSMNYLIDPMVNKVRGARFSMPEARGLLLGLGIVLE